ncbi:ABC transporter permease [Arsenicicoccus bolidensis]|uniref:ABC transporter permease n=1 Tax=Arsenicicoccus bolidensis TaxID=229480 RepID=UPI0028A8B5C7|nr:ABC transporter permease [Arsenicicoccus bolidensis]
MSSRTPSSPASSVARGRRRVDASLVVGAVLVGLVVVTALVSFVWTPHPPGLTDGSVALRGPMAGYPLGTDRLGQDELSRLMVGARTTLLVGIVAVGLAAVVGVPLGVLAGMRGGLVGRLVMRANDLLLAFPALLLAIMLAAARGGSTTVAMVAIGIASIPTFARVTRSGVLSIMQREYVMAARSAGRTPLGIAVHHVLPGVANLVIVQSSVAFGMAILAEAGLSYLGVGTPPDVPSWGRMLYDSQATLWQTPRLAWIPGLAIALAVLGFNLLGDGLRDLLDPTLEDRR